MLELPEAIDILTNTQVNCQLEFTTDRDGYLLYELRCLPWRNTPRSGYMVLVADHAISSVLCRAADELEANRWTPINWRVHLTEPGVYYGMNIGPVIKGNDTAPENRPKLRFVPDVTQNTAEPPKDR